MPGNYMVTLFSFGRFIRQENPSYCIRGHRGQIYGGS